MNFETLLKHIGAVDEYARRDTARAINIGLTLRNWSIGLYFSRYELHGEDRAKHGDELFVRLAAELTTCGVKSCDRRQLYRYRDFYQTYPQIVGTLSPQLQSMLPKGSLDKKVGTASPLSVLLETAFGSKRCR